MSPWRLESRPVYRVCLGPQGWAGRRVSPWPVSRAVSTVRRGAGLPDADAQFEQWCRSHPNSRCELLLSTHWVHSLLIDPALPPMGPPALREHARQQFAHYHGSAALRWPVALGSLRGVRVACAPDGPDLTSWAEIARRYAVRLGAVRPLWPALWRLALAEPVPPRALQDELAQLALAEPGVALCVGLERGQPVELRRRWPEPSREVPLAWTVSHDLTPDDRLPALGLDTPASATGDFDFLGGAARAPAWSWALAAAGITTLALGLADARDMQSQIAAADQRVAELQAAVGRRMPPPARAAAADTAALVQDAKATVTRLAHPWPAVLGAVEAAAGPGVQLLTLAHDAGRPLLRVGGSAVDDRAFQRFVTHLAQTPTLDGVALVSQRTAREPGDAAAVRFELEARVRLPLGGAP